MANLILLMGRTSHEPALFVRYNRRMNVELNGACERHFQLSSEGRKDYDDDRVSECVIGSKICLTSQELPVADLFSHLGLKLSSDAAIGSGGRRDGGLTNCQHTRQREITFVFFQPFEG